MSRSLDAGPRWGSRVAVVILLGAAAPLLGASASRAAPLAVIPATGAGLDEVALGRLDRALFTELERRGQELMRPDEVAPQVASARALGLDCAGDDVECLLKLGTVAGFGAILGVQASGVGGHDAVVQLTLLRVDPPEVAGTTQASLSLAGEPNVRGLVIALLAPAEYVGSLMVSGVGPGARILVDGELRGTAPLAGPVGDLAVGIHKVRVEQEGAPPLDTQVVVRFEETASLELTMANPAVPAAVSAGDVEPAASSSEAEVDPLFFALTLSGAGVAVVGAVMAVGGAAALGGGEAYLDLGIGQYNDRAAAQLVGRIGILVLVAGGAVVLGGAGLAATGFIL